MLTNADMKFPAALSSKQEPFDVTQSNIDTLMENPDREVRRSAWENYFGGYKAVQNTMAASLVTAFKRDTFIARTHGYASSLESALFPNAIKTEVFHNLIETVKKNQHIWHCYFAIRKQALGYETLHPYDVWVPLTNNPPVVPYQQGVDYISEGLSPLGADYVNVLRRGCLQDRWVDVYPNQGKTQGAFSTGASGTHPFILMSYTDDLQSMSTLAHELGEEGVARRQSALQVALIAGISAPSDFLMASSVAQLQDPSGPAGNVPGRSHIQWYRPTCNQRRRAWAPRARKSPTTRHIL
jgi:oligoendopeptidase F